jgi:hypothetical protein
VPRSTQRTESVLPLKGISDDRRASIAQVLIRMATEVLDEEGSLRYTDVAALAWSVKRNGPSRAAMPVEPRPNAIAVRSVARS